MKTSVPTDDQFCQAEVSEYNDVMGPSMKSDQTDQARTDQNQDHEVSDLNDIVGEQFGQEACQAHLTYHCIQ